MLEQKIRESLLMLANLRRLRAWEKRRDQRIHAFLAGEPIPINQIPKLLWDRRQAG